MNYYVGQEVVVLGTKIIAIIVAFHDYGIELLGYNYHEVVNYGDIKHVK